MERTMLRKLRDSKPIKNAMAVLLLFAITLGVFQYTLRIRKPWFGMLSMKGGQSNSGKTLLYCKNWYREGPLNLRFAMLKNPDSIEFPTLLSRDPYISYPPGAVLPIYIISKVRKHEPTVSILMKYNLLNHFLVAFFLSLTSFFFLLQLKFNYLDSFILSIIPISLELLLPAPLYWHQNVFFTDQAVIFPFILFVFLEIIRKPTSNKRTLSPMNFLQGSLFFYGTLTDWLFVFVAFVVYIKRIVNGEIKGEPKSFLITSIAYWFPGVLALFLYGIQLYSLCGFNRLIERFLFRTGLSARGAGYTVDFYHKFWERGIANGFGGVAVRLLWISLFLLVLSLVYMAFCYFGKKEIEQETKQVVSLIWMVLIPCFFYTYLFRNNCAIHEFTALKFSIPLALVPFVLMPILIFSLLRIDFIDASLVLKVWHKNRSKDVTFSLPIMTLCIIILVSIYLRNEHPRFKTFFSEPDRLGEEIGRFLSSNTRYNDVVFSPDFDIDIRRSRILHISMKRVYKAQSLFEIYSKVRPIMDSDFEVDIFSLGGELPANDDVGGIKELLSAAYDIKRSGTLSLYKINKEDFLRKFEKVRKQTGDSLLILVEQVLKTKDVSELLQYEAKFKLMQLFYPEIYARLIEKIEKSEVGNDLLKRINDITKREDVFELHKLKEQCRFIEQVYPKAYADINGAYETLVTKYTSEYPVTKEVSLAGYRYEKAGDGKYKFYFLFKVKDRLKKDWNVYIHAYVKDGDIGLLPEKRRKHGFANWGIKPDPPTSTWAKDQYIMLTREISANPGAYKVCLGLYRPKKGRSGQEVNLGWLKLE